MHNYSVEARSREDLRRLAHILREHLELDNEIRVPIVELLDILPEIFGDFSYEIVEDSQMNIGVHAETNIATGHIMIRESVYEGACDGNGRDRMTIAHEIGHYITLCICDFKLQRNFKEDDIKSYNDPEWQAKCFAGELLIDCRLTSGMSVDEVATACGVSRAAAAYQLSHVK